MCNFGDAKDPYTGQYLSNLTGIIYRPDAGVPFNKPSIHNLTQESLRGRTPNMLYLIKHKQPLGGIAASLMNEKRGLRGIIGMVTNNSFKVIPKSDYLPVPKRASMIEVSKQAAISDIAAGSITGAAIGGTLGYGAGKLAESKILKDLPESVKHVLKNTLTQEAVNRIVFGTSAVGAISGAASGQIVATKKDNENPYYKYGSNNKIIKNLKLDNIPDTKINSMVIAYPEFKKQSVSHAELDKSEGFDIHDIHGNKIEQSQGMHIVGSFSKHDKDIATGKLMSKTYTGYDSKTNNHAVFTRFNHITKVPEGRRPLHANFIHVSKDKNEVETIAHNIVDNKDELGKLLQNNPSLFMDRIKVPIESTSIIKSLFKKWASDPEHAFISETNLEPFAQVPMPADVSNAVNMEHWWLKYLPGIGYGSGGLSSAIADVAKGHSINKYKLLSTALSTGVASHLIKNSLEKKYAKPYMKHLAKEVDRKYKRGSAHEFISDTGVQIAPKDLGNKEILSVIHYRHPYLDQIPMISAAVGGITGRVLDKATPFHSSVLGSMVGGTAGKAVELLLTEMSLNPYRKKYVQEVKKKYNIKHANIFSVGGDLLSGILNNPISNTINNIAIADIGSQAIKVHPTHTTLHVPYTNIHTTAPNFIHKITSGIKNKYEKTVPQDLRHDLHEVKEFSNRMADKMFPLIIAKGVGDATGAFNRDKDPRAQYIAKIKKQNELLNSSKYVGGLKAMEI